MGALIIAALAGVGVWTSAHPDAYGPSRNGCVNVTVRSSTGGAISHNCGTAARTLCQSAFAQSDQLSLATRRQCVLAGIAPSPAASATP